MDSDKTKCLACREEYVPDEGHEYTCHACTPPPVVIHIVADVERPHRSMAEAKAAMDRLRCEVEAIPKEDDAQAPEEQA